MKNIHLLPTDKPSRLFKNLKLDTWDTSKEYLKDTTYLKNHNIYITDDSEIKEGDWYYLPKENKIAKCPKMLNLRSVTPEWTQKIILTTDQDLIADGVQEISDEFLEWFVENPSCEEVDVYKDKRLKIEQDFDFYEIIIPKEEPKPVWQQIIETCGGEEEFMESAGLLSKQETLEEFTENYINKFYNDYAFKDLLKPLLIEGANWQAERMYSEEDMKQAFFDGVRVTGEGYNGEYASGNHPDIEVEFYESYTEWFNKIKKK